METIPPQLPRERTAIPSVETLQSTWAAHLPPWVTRSRGRYIVLERDDSGTGGSDGRGQGTITQLLRGRRAYRQYSQRHSVDTGSPR